MKKLRPIQFKSDKERVEFLSKVIEDTTELMTRGLAAGDPTLKLRVRQALVDELSPDHVATCVQFVADYDRRLLSLGEEDLCHIYKSVVENMIETYRAHFRKSASRFQSNSHVNIYSRAPAEFPINLIPRRFRQFADKCYEDIERQFREVRGTRIKARPSILRDTRIYHIYRCDFTVNGEWYVYVGMSENCLERWTEHVFEALCIRLGAKKSGTYFHERLSESEMIGDRDLLDGRFSTEEQLGQLFSKVDKVIGRRKATRLEQEWIDALDAGNIGEGGCNTGIAAAR